MIQYPKTLCNHACITAHTCAQKALIRFIWLFQWFRGGKGACICREASPVRMRRRQKQRESSCCGGNVLKTVLSIYSFQHLSGARTNNRCTRSFWGHLFSNISRISAYVHANVYPFVIFIRYTNIYLFPSVFFWFKVYLPVQRWRFWTASFTH